MSAELEQILNDLSSHGKFGAIVTFKDQSKHLKTIGDRIIKLFNPEAFSYSKFDITTSEMEFLDKMAPAADSEVIFKIIYQKGEDKIILQQYKDLFQVEHVLSPVDIGTATGKNVIRDFFYEKPNSELVLGFELSLNIESYDESLNEIKRESFQPIVILTNENDLVEKYAYGTYGEQITVEEMKYIDAYLAFI